MTDDDLVALAEDIKASLDATREQTKTYGAQIDSLKANNKSLKEAQQRSRLHIVLLAGLIAAVCLIGLAGWLDDHNDDEALREREAREDVVACERANESRAQIRDIARDAAFASGEEGGEALIEAAGGEADPARVEAYRSILAERLTTRLDDIVNQLEDRDC